jgi:hypothetical protein
VCVATRTHTNEGYSRGTRVALRGAREEYSRGTRMSTPRVLDGYSRGTPPGVRERTSSRPLREGARDERRRAAAVGGADEQPHRLQARDCPRSGSSRGYSEYSQRVLGVLPCDQCDARRRATGGAAQSGTVKMGVLSGYCKNGVLSGYCKNGVLSGTVKMGYCRGTLTRLGPERLSLEAQ